MKTEILLTVCIMALLYLAISPNFVEKQPEPVKKSTCFDEDFIAFIQTDEEDSVDELHLVKCERDRHCRGIHPMNQVTAGYEIDLTTEVGDGELLPQRVLFIDEEPVM